MKFTDYKKQNPDFDIFDNYLPEIVDSGDQDECKANILYVIQETAGLKEDLQEFLETGSINDLDLYKEFKKSSESNEFKLFKEFIEFQKMRNNSLEFKSHDTDLISKELEKENKELKNKLSKVQKIIE